MTDVDATERLVNFQADRARDELLLMFVITAR